MNSNRSEDVLSGGYGMSFLSCFLWLTAMFIAAKLLLEKRDVKA